MTELNHAYDPLHFVLLFPRGEAGWHDGFESTLFTPHQINIDENDWGGR